MTHRVMEKNPELIKFPCSYPLKVLGRNTSEFYGVVRGILEKHLANGSYVTYTTRTSRGEKYLAVTATFIAENREMVAAIYEELGMHELVLVTM